jgi:hypothetical protein
MSEQQLAELEQELSQQMSSDEKMMMNYEIRFWKQKAWRAEQQRDRAEVAQKEAEGMIQKYKAIPEDVLDKFLLEAKENELKKLKDAASVHISTIGLTNFRSIVQQADLANTIDAKINIWKDVISNYRAYAPCDEEEAEESD